MSHFERYPFLRNEKGRPADEVNAKIAKVPCIYLGYEVNTSQNLFELMGAMSRWFEENSEYLKPKKSEKPEKSKKSEKPEKSKTAVEIMYMSLSAAICYPEANIQQLVALTISLRK